MSLTEENRRDIVSYRIERANVALDQAKLNLQMNCLEVTANRLYYAAYYAVSALLTYRSICEKDLFFSPSIFIIILYTGLGIIGH